MEEWQETIHRAQALRGHILNIQNTDPNHGTCLALWSSRCLLKAKSCHGFHGFRGFYEGTAKMRCFLQPPGCRQRRRHHSVRLDTRMPYAYEFVKSVESVAAFEGAQQLQILNMVRAGTIISETAFFYGSRPSRRMRQGSSGHLHASAVSNFVVSAASLIVCATRDLPASGRGGSPQRQKVFHRVPSDAGADRRDMMIEPIKSFL